MKLVSIILPTFNGLDLLKNYLPSVIEAARYIKTIDEIKAEVVVVDDGSTDGTSDFVRRDFSTVKVVTLKKQTGFAHACNYGAECSRGEMLIFLNNDVRVEPGFIKPLLKHLEKEGTFAAGAKSITSKDWLYNEAVSQAYWGKGFFTLIHPQRDKKKDFLDKERPILYPCGVAFACKRDKFFKLGRFDEIYTPFFWEDVDLGYRSWKRGWEILYEPKSLVYHGHRQTISRVVSNRYAEEIFLRNSFVFTWKNITSRKMFYGHLFYLGYWIGMVLIQGRWMDLVAVGGALKRLPEILKKRRAEKKEEIWSDEEVLRKTWQTQNLP